MMFLSTRKLVLIATKRFVVGRKRKSIWVTGVISDNSKYRTTRSVSILPESSKTIYMVYFQICLGTGKFSPYLSQYTTLNKTGWTVTIPMASMMMTWEGGQSVWERFEELIIEFDD